MDIEIVKEKIKKLLNLSENNHSDGETTAALKKAQQLMAQYKLERKDISDEAKKQECIQRKTLLSYGSRSSDYYLSDLADIIAENFCCVSYISTPGGSRTHYICFMGLEEDVEIATEVLYVANRYIINGYNRVYKAMCEEHSINYIPAKYFNPRKCGYVEGYLKGLKEALAAQKESNKQEWGLVLVTPKEAQDFVADLSVLTSSHVTKVERSYYSDGYSDGKEFRLNEKIETDYTDKQLID